MEAAIDTRRNLPLKKRFSKILNSEIANGNASDDTVKTYTQQFKLFVAWCDRVGLRLETATEEDILDYRRYLVNKKLSHATISLKLTVIRRIYAIALKRGFVATNPARDVQPPPKRRDP
ncbi:MAG: phage integrase SAM-like domain-containing protein, partial [Prochloraceae cyanobacterium]